MGAGEAGLPVSHTRTLRSALGRSKAPSLASKPRATRRACRYLNPTAREGAGGDPSAPAQPASMNKADELPYR